MTTLTQLSKELNAHLDAKTTTAATFEWVNNFYRTDIDMGHSAQGMMDRVALLEARMAREHGWTR